MKESRLIIIVSLCLFVVLGPIIYLFYKLFPNLLDYMGVATNIYCGIIVALVTSICQYYSSKTRIINCVYSSYLDLYRAFYYINNRIESFNLNSNALNNKIIEVNAKVLDALDEYHGLIKKYDKTYEKLSPTVNLLDESEGKEIVRFFVSSFKSSSFKELHDLLIKNIENILISINEKRFESDKSSMIKFFDYISGDEDV